MEMNNILRKMAVFLERKQDLLFSYDVNKQKKYIAKLGNPRDKIERSYFQYKCQMQLNGKVITAILNLISFPLVIIYFIKYGRKTEVHNSKQEKVIFFRDGKPENILPNSLKEKYKKVEYNPDEGMILTKKDKEFIKRIIYRYPFSWQFILKCMIKIGKYSFAIKKYSPTVVVVCAEYSFTSSLLTYYCNQRNIMHINVMHGEKLYYMRDSFFEFNECYIWDKYYENIFISLKAARKQFIIEVPASLQFDKELIKSNLYDYTYYLGAESEKVLRLISVILKQLCNSGNKISVRPHPRYSNIKLVKEIFSFANIEDTKKISIEQSLLQTNAAISLYSTVLNQALCNSIPIIIDNVSDPKKFNKLKELGYVCLYKKHKLLSNILENEYD